MKADLAAGVTLTALGLLIAFGDGASAHALLMPAATLPVIWRRQAPDAAALALAAGILATAGLPRCGAVIPAALLVLYALGDRLAAPAAVLGALVLLAFTDPIISPAALEFILPLGAGVWAAGRLVRSRDRVARELAARSRELERQRERTAQLAVALERTRLAGALDVAARDRTRRMVELAERGEREAFGEIERLGRETLHELRELLGTLRSRPEPEATDA